MHNYIRSQTRLAFVQYIFLSEFLNLKSFESIEDFEKSFYDSDISIIGEKKEFKLKFNKNFLRKLSENYLFNFDKDNNINKINTYSDIERKFDKWNSVLKSIIFAFISELQITEDKKTKIVINDYINIAKSLVSSKETKLMNAIIQKILDDKEK